MGPKPSQQQFGDLFRPRLDEQLSMMHPLVRLAALIDWTEIECTFAVSFTFCRGRPAFPPRLVEGCLRNSSRRVALRCCLKSDCASAAAARVRCFMAQEFTQTEAAAGTFSALP